MHTKLGSASTVLLSLPGSLCWLRVPAALRELHCGRHQLLASEVCCLMSECVHVKCVWGGGGGGGGGEEGQDGRWWTGEKGEWKGGGGGGGGGGR